VSLAPSPSSKSARGKAWSLIASRYSCTASGNEIGPFSALEQSMVSQLTTPDGRVSILMWYQVLGFLGVATGNGLAGVIVSSLESRGKPTVDAYRGVFVAYSIVAGIKIVLSFCMSTYTEVNHPPIPEPPSSATAPSGADSERQPLLRSSEDARSDAPSTIAQAVFEPPTIPAPPPGLPIARLVILAAIFSLDSFASSLIPLSFISYYFRKDFGASVAIITRTFSTTAIISLFSQLCAGSIAKRAGIIVRIRSSRLPPSDLLTFRWSL